MATALRIMIGRAGSNIILDVIMTGGTVVITNVPPKDPDKEEIKETLHDLIEWLGSYKKFQGIASGQTDEAD